MVVTRTPPRLHQAHARRASTRRRAAAAAASPAPTSTEGDFVADMFAASTHDHLLLFTDKGRVYYKKVFELPEGARTAKGRAIVNVLDLQDGEQVVAMLPFKEFREDTSVFFATQAGTVKKTELSAVRERAAERHQGDHDRGRRPARRRRARRRKARRRAADVGARASRCGSPRSRVRADGPQRRAACAASRCARATGSSACVTFARDVRRRRSITVCERGYGKRTALADYPTKNRGGKGVITIKTTARNGQVSRRAHRHRGRSPDPDLRPRQADPHPRAATSRSRAARPRACA